MGCCAQCLQVREGADAGGCCNMHLPKDAGVVRSCCLLLASSWGCVGEHFGTLLDQICTCCLPWQ